MDVEAEVGAEVEIKKEVAEHVEEVVVAVTVAVVHEGGNSNSADTGEGNRTTRRSPTEQQAHIPGIARRRPEEILQKPARFVVAALTPPQTANPAA